MDPWKLGTLVQNPMNVVGEPDHAPGSAPLSFLILLLAAYALAAWLLFGPCRSWTERHQGWAYLALALGPGAVVLLILSL